MRSFVMALALAGASTAVAEDGGFERERGRLFASIDVDNGGAVAAVLGKAAYRSMFTTPEESAAIVTALLQTSTGSPRCQKEAAGAVADAGLAVSDAQLAQAARSCPALVEKLWRNASTRGVLGAMRVVDERIADPDRDYGEGLAVLENVRGGVLSRCADQRACPEADEATTIVDSATLKERGVRRARVEQLPGKTIVDKVHDGIVDETIGERDAMVVLLALSDAELAALNARATKTLSAACSSSSFAVERAGSVGVRWLKVFVAFDERCAAAAKPGPGCAKRLAPSDALGRCLAEHEAFVVRALKKTKPADAVQVVNAILVPDVVRGNAQVSIAVGWLNQTSARIVGVVVSASVANPFGGVAWSGTTEKLVSLAPGDGDVSRDVFVFVDNPYKTGEPYDRLQQLAEGDGAKVTITVKKVLFDNGVVLGR